MTHFSSLSSRAASFFCFLMSSRFLRASARSLTALSLSLLRLSHSVLCTHRWTRFHKVSHRMLTSLFSSKSFLFPQNRQTYFQPTPYRMLSLSATILSLSWKAQSRRHLATSASCRASFSSWEMASYCFLSISISLLARSMSRVAESCFWRSWRKCKVMTLNVAL